MAFHNLSLRLFLQLYLNTHACAILFCARALVINLRTFALKSSYGEIFFISPLELVHKVLTPKMKKKNGGHRLCFGENGSGKMP